MIGNKGGRPSHWKSSNKTRLVRIPEHMADEILEIARLKDKGEDISIVQNQITELDRLASIIKEFKLQSKPGSRDWKKVDQLIAEIESKINFNQG